MKVLRFDTTCITIIALCISVHRCDGDILFNMSGAFCASNDNGKLIQSNRTFHTVRDNKITNIYAKSNKYGIILEASSKPNLVSSFNRREYAATNVIKFQLDLPVQMTPLFCRINHTENDSNTQLFPLIQLLKYVALHYMYGCSIIVLYDENYDINDPWILEYFLRYYPLPFIHGKIEGGNWKVDSRLLYSPGGKCRGYVILVDELEGNGGVLGAQSVSRVVVVTRASRSAIGDYLTHPIARNILNLLVVAIPDPENFSTQSVISDKKFPDINLYTHHLFIDANGSSVPVILTAWRCTALTRPHINLFPTKKIQNFHGHRFVTAVGIQPPFVFQRNCRRCNAVTEFKSQVVWDGVEIRLINLLALFLNFTPIITESSNKGSRNQVASMVVEEIITGRADIAAAGIYTTPNRIFNVTMSSPHSLDCATFISLASSSLPRYRAIMGPFHWGVWLALTLTYLLAIFPLAFSHRHSLTHLLTNPWEMENMFWYVFGTFTNCFTFTGSGSWSGTDKSATRMLIGWYWIFSIIITACYTGSIIAFVTLPVFPAVVDTSRQILEKNFLIGTLGSGGWEHWFHNSSDPIVTKLLRKMEYLPTVFDGLDNITKAYYQPYAFLGSKSFLEYTVSANYTPSFEVKRAKFHLAKECFVPFHVALAFPKQAIYTETINHVILSASETGMISKILRDVGWEISRSSSGKLLKAAVSSSPKILQSAEKKLSLDDIQGTFLLLGAGFAIGFFVFFLECMSWVAHKKCLKSNMKSVHSSICTDAGSGLELYERLSSIRKAKSVVSIKHYNLPCNADAVSVKPDPNKYICSHQSQELYRLKTMEHRDSNFTSSNSSSPSEVWEQLLVTCNTGQMSRDVYSNNYIETSLRDHEKWFGEHI